MATVALPDVEHGVLDRLERLYHLVLLDDDDHTYDYVVEMLVKIFRFTEKTAFEHAVEVDREGRTILFTGSLEEAQGKQQQIRDYGADWRLERSKASMSSVIEPATSE